MSDTQKQSLIQYLQKDLSKGDVSGTHLLEILKSVKTTNTEAVLQQNILESQKKLKEQDETTILHVLNRVISNYR